MRLIVLNEQMEESIEKIEAVISDLVRNSEDLSDIVAAQDKEISRIKDSLQCRDCLWVKRRPLLLFLPRASSNHVLFELHP